ncbi:MAG: heavy metal translocating P-type ATPase [Treponemataceae bacterium]|nr:MAG: heavy metal translocating P-type ATPase [Treponemataceae bacterium]
MSCSCCEPCSETRRIFGGAAAAKNVDWKKIRCIVGAVFFAAALAAPRLLHISWGAWNAAGEAALFFAAYILIGGDVILRALKNIVSGKIFDENFLMTLATVGAFAIGEFPEGVAVMLFYQIGEAFEERAVEKSKKSIEDLMDIRPDFANRKTADGQIEKVNPEEVKIGEVIIVRPGEKIPLDGVILEGESALDVSMLTGESLPREVGAGSEVLSGSVNKSGLLTVRVEKVFGESTASRILKLVQNAEGKKSKTENFITKFARAYTPAVVLAAALLAFLPPLVSGFSSELFSVWVHRALIFLVVSCPCALVISVPLTFFAGLGAAAKNGILVKGAKYLEVLSKCKIAVFDKTGTLTKGKFAVSRAETAAGFTQAELAQAAFAAEQYSNHPLAVCVKDWAASLTSADEIQCESYTELAGLGIEAKLQNGAVVLAGKKALLQQNGCSISAISSIVPDAATEDATAIYVALKKQGERAFSFAGSIFAADTLKDGTKKAIADLKKLGVKRCVMLTGDTQSVAARIASECGIDTVFAGLMPDEKCAKIETLLAQKGNEEKLVFAGDGINDAPSLALSDAGIAMGGVGSDAAIEASDIVFMTDELTKLPLAIRIAHNTMRIAKENIVFALGVKAVILGLSAFGLTSMWAAVFADVGVALLATLNAIKAGRATARPCARSFA